MKKMLKKYPKEELMESVNPLKAILILGIPTLISSLAGLLVTLIDILFFAAIDPNGLSIGTIFMPLLAVMILASGFIVMGVAPYLGQKYGENKLEEANSFFSTALVGVIIASVAAVIFVVPNLDTILPKIGATPLIFDLVKDYSEVMLLNVPLMSITMLLSVGRSMQGDTKTSMHASLIGIAINLVFNSVFVFVFDMGASGIALSTVIATVVRLIFTSTKYMGSESVFKFKSSLIKFSKAFFIQIFRIGVPIALSFVFIMLTDLAFNVFITSQVADPTKLTDILVSKSILGIGNMVIGTVMYGLIGGSSALYSFNYGADNFKRIKVVSLWGVIIPLIIGFIVSVVIVINTDLIISTIGVTEQAGRIASKFFPLMAISSLLMISYSTVTSLAKSTSDTKVMIIFNTVIDSLSYALFVFGVPIIFGWEYTAAAVALQCIFIGIIAAIIIPFYFRRIKRRMSEKEMEEDNIVKNFP